MRPSRSLLLCVAVAVVTAGLALVAPSPASAAATPTLAATFAKVSTWGSGWQGEYTITNGGSSAITSWRVEFDLPAGTAVGSHWNALLTTSGQHFTFANQSWNGTIAPGAKVKIGFIGTGSGSPAGCRLNGVSCTGETTHPGTTPVAINGQLAVCGRQLCNAQGRPIQLRGMSTHGIQWYADCVNDASLDVLAGEWNADILRISMYIQEGGYETDPAGFTAKVNDYIEKATARGLYAIVDWHMLSPGDPNANLDRARTFFQQIASRHKDKTNVLYEIANEPSGVHWDSIRSYADQIIPVIRAEDPEAVVLVGTEDWSSLGASGDGQGVARILANPVRAGNVMYTFHFYAASHDDWYLDTFTDAVAKLPMFVTEFGTQEYSGDGPDNFDRAQQYLDLMAQHRVSWTNWNFSDDFRSGAVFTEGTCAAGAYTGTANLKPAGAWIRDRIRTPDDF
ncbi:cellulase family glycosylhydrolase [Paractinoplanes rishiriensis]|uniref:Endoglucanase n=1 Tax=Paractinoplanes rishiriensis TaxID=1050105 RepID=A0A919K224_9ACTN|nr:cellulase family glycosylhydrolase [Actinoplanes rishiriensis]GIE97600.1 endoglucanase [Actinoplanes rishiriensis]